MKYKIFCFNIVLVIVLFFFSLTNSLGALAQINTIAQESCPNNMVFISDETFDLGDSHNFLEDRVVKQTKINNFCIDKTEVTNSQFARFVEETGYITVAERPLSIEDFPNLTEDKRLPGSVVFTMPKQGLKPIPELSWWKWKPGANWRHPCGSNSNIEARDNYPVIHIAYEDALAYARWAGKQLPTEAQWEYAARGGLKGKTYVWGDRYSANKANTWQGSFPFFNTKEDGYKNTAPVASFEPNGYGLYDMAGNVWEWTSDPYYGNRSKSAEQELGLLKTIKGGSYLCAPNYCSRYRIASRESQELSTGTSHIGFRLVKNLELVK